jgi:hypothetical protein
MKHVAHFFKHNTESNECFETADGMLFYRVMDAHSHASELKVKDVKEYKRHSEEVQSALADYDAKAEGKVVELKDVSQADGNTVGQEAAKTETGAEGGEAGAEGGKTETAAEGEAPAKAGEKKASKAKAK